MTIDKLKRNIITNFLKEKQVGKDEWKCCDYQFSSISKMGRHVHETHESDIADREQQERSKAQELQKQQDSLKKMKQRRAVKGSSDPISANCQCDLDKYKVILFYRYVQIDDPIKFVLDHEEYCKNMSGKVRIANEGINATLAGTDKEIDMYLNWITSTQPFNDLQHLKAHTPLSLSAPNTARYQFFKPSKGCTHVFSELSIKLVDEVCPLRQTSINVDGLTKPHHQFGKLSPKDFHQALSKRYQDEVLLLDTRNYYESKIGYFEGAVKPQIRKFSQFPEYINRNKEELQGKTILTYCTGGIRCEKATAYMRQALSEDTEIFMLDGGIHNYMEWWKTESDSNTSSEDPVWQGKNYVFDARQSLALDDGSIVSRCQKCDVPWDNYKKCASLGCHLLVLYCDLCSSKASNVYCCLECEHGQENGLCLCEKQRRIKELEKIS